MASANDDLPGKGTTIAVWPGAIPAPKSTGQRHLHNLTWGLLPYRTPDPTRALRPIYALAETVAEIEKFADAFRRRRAIFPADSYQQQRTTGGRTYKPGHAVDLAG